MTKLPKSLQSIADNFDEAEEKKQFKFINDCYTKRDMSYSEIAEICGTYPNKIRRLHKKGGGEPRSRSSAQSLALSQGRHAHPTKGKGHSLESKQKIGESMSKVWDELSPEELEYRKQIGREVWDNMTPAERDALHFRAGQAIREAARSGSKLEKYLREELTKAGHVIEFHKKHLIKNENLHIDIFVPGLVTAIEVDGPSHFSDIWGADVLAKNKKADKEKDALLLGNGFCVIRIRQAKTPSEVAKRRILAELLEKLDEWKTYPSRKKRFYVIGD